MTIPDVLLIVFFVMLALPIAVVACEVAAAFFWNEGWHATHDLPTDAPDPHLPVAVLIPAHNEESEIATSITSIKHQLSSGDRVIVVADNCTDRTAELARDAGAEVLERADTAFVGKGYALAAGIKHLQDNPPAIVIILDADMRAEPGTLRTLSIAATAFFAPIQAVDLLEPPAHASRSSRISSLAFTFKNLVRALGAEALGIPCLLRGTGMAFPWKLAQNTRWATGNIVEDMEISIQLALAGHTPRFCPQARVTGTLPERQSAAAVQRTRWEHGHLQTILHSVPRLFWQSIKQRRLDLAALACDLAVPPLALLVLAWFGLTALATLAAMLGFASHLPMWGFLGLGGVLAFAIIAGWAGFARKTLPLSQLLSVPFYVLWKVPLYLNFLIRRQQTWVRTERAS